jgi:hypothetical protein
MRLELALTLFAVTDLATAVGPCFCCDFTAAATAGKALFVTGYDNCEDMKGKLRLIEKKIFTKNKSPRL